MTTATCKYEQCDKMCRRAEVKIHLRLVVAGALAILGSDKVTLNEANRMHHRHRANNLLQEALLLASEHPSLIPATRARVRKIQEVLNR